MNAQEALAIASIHGFPSVKYATNRIRNAHEKFRIKMYDPTRKYTTQVMNEVAFSVCLTIDAIREDMEGAFAVAMQHAIDKFPNPIWIDSPDDRIIWIFDGSEDEVVERIEQALDQLEALIREL